MTPFREPRGPWFFLKSSRKIRSHTDVLGLRNPPPLAEEKRARDRALRMSAWEAKARFSRRSTHVPNLTDELSTAKERLLNQFGTAFLVWYGKSVKFNRVCRTFVELNLGSTHGTPSESDVAPVSLQSRTYSVRFGTWKVRRLNQAWAAVVWFNAFL